MRQWLKTAKQEQLTGKTFIKMAPALDALAGIQTFMQRADIGFQLPRFFWSRFPRLSGSVKLVPGGDTSVQTLARALSLLKSGVGYEELMPTQIKKMMCSNFIHPLLREANTESNELFLTLSRGVIDSLSTIDLTRLRSDIGQNVILEAYLTTSADHPPSLSDPRLADRVDMLVHSVVSVYLMRTLIDICMETCSLDALLYLANPNYDDRFKKLCDIERRTRAASTDAKRKQLRLEKRKIVYRQAFAELRTQWEDLEPPKVLSIAAEAYWVDPTASPKRTEKEELKCVRREFPGLYHLATHPSPSEIQQIRERRANNRLLKDLVRRLEKESIPASFYVTRINNGTRDFDKIVKRYRLHCIRRDKHKSVQLPSDSTGSNGFASKEEFLGSISFSSATDEHIRAAGLTSRDVVFGICKGFDFGKGSGGGAVGFSHYQGPKIRSSISRHCSVSPKTFLAYLESVDLLRRFGSGSKGRTKDDAMSINTDPSTEVGKEILSNLNGAFLDLRTAM